MANERVVERDGSREDLAAAFAQPLAQGEMIPYVAPGTISTTDGVITAQKVAVARQVGKVLADIKAMAAAAGDDWYYRFPVKNKDGSTDWIEGCSIKAANNVARMYGNCQIDTRVVDVGDSWIIYARFVDYETGFSYTRPFQQRKNQRALGTKDQGRALDIALQIGVSKAIRNVVCNSLETFTTYAFEEAKRGIVDKVGKNLDAYRAKVLERLDTLKVELKRVETVTGRVAKDWLAHDVARLIAQLQSIADGMATPDETWPGDAPPRPTREDVQQQQERPKETKPAAPTHWWDFTNEDGEVVSGLGTTQFEELLIEAVKHAAAIGVVNGLLESNAVTLASIRAIPGAAEAIERIGAAVVEANAKFKIETAAPSDAAVPNGRGPEPAAVSQATPQAEGAVAATPTQQDTPQGPSGTAREASSDPATVTPATGGVQPVVPPPAAKTEEPSPEPAGEGGGSNFNSNDVYLSLYEGLVDQLTEPALNEYLKIWQHQMIALKDHDKKMAARLDKRVAEHREKVRRK